MVIYISCGNVVDLERTVQILFGIQKELTFHLVDITIQETERKERLARIK